VFNAFTTVYPHSGVLVLTNSGAIIGAAPALLS